MTGVSDVQKKKNFSVSTQLKFKVGILTSFGIPSLVGFIMLTIAGMHIGNERIDAYRHAIRNLLDNNAISSADPKVLKMLSEAIALHFKEMGTLPKDLDMDAFVKQLMNKQYPQFMDEKRVMFAPMSSPAAYALALIGMIVAGILILLLCVDIHRACKQINQKNLLGKNRQDSSSKDPKGIKNPSKYFLIMGITCAMLGFSFMIYAKIKDIAISASSIFALQEKFDKILPDTIAAYKNGSYAAFTDVDNVKRIFEHYLNQTSDTYNQLSASTLLFSFMVAFFVVSVILVLTSLLSFVHFRQEKAEMLNAHNNNPDERTKLTTATEQNDHTTRKSEPSKTTQKSESITTSGQEHVAIKKGAQEHVAIKENDLSPLLENMEESHEGVSFKFENQNGREQQVESIEMFSHPSTALRVSEVTSGTSVRPQVQMMGSQL